MQYNVTETKNKRIQVGHIPLVARWFTPEPPCTEHKGFIRIHFGSFYPLHEELVIKPFQERMDTLGNMKGLKVVKRNPHIYDQESHPETHMTFRVDLPIGPIISLFISLKRESDKPKHIKLTEVQSYLMAYKICAYEYNLTITGSPLLQTHINNSINNTNLIYNTQLLLPKFSEFDNIYKREEDVSHCAEIFIKNNYNNTFHKPLHEAFEYLTHYIHRVTQSNEQN